jgi:hypothetical protein
VTEPLLVKKPKSRKFLLALGAIATTIATIAHLLVGAPLPSKEALAPAPVLVVEEAPAAEPEAVEAPAAAQGTSQGTEEVAQ